MMQDFEKFYESKLRRCFRLYKLSARKEVFLNMFVSRSIDLK